jgi:hypothetical protein
MSEVKEIKFTAPLPIRKTRRGKRAGALSEPVKTDGNTLPLKSGGDPLPVLSTTRVVGGKKPSLKVALPYSESPKTPSPDKPSIKIVTTPKASIVKKAVPVTPKVVIQQNKRKNVTLKRKFFNKRITINVENSKKIKKMRSAVEEKVNNLSPCEILKSLREKGLVRPKANPPEEMIKSMMVDIMMFPKPL